MKHVLSHLIVKPIIYLQLDFAMCDILNIISSVNIAEIENKWYMWLCRDSKPGSFYFFFK